MLRSNWLWIWIALLAAPGCQKTGGPFEDVSGTYVGTVAVATQTLGAKATTSVLSDRELLVTLETTDASARSWKLDAKIGDGGELDVTLGQEAPVRFKASDGGCFVSETGNARLCVDPDEVLLSGFGGEIQGFDLRKSDPNANVTLETPAPFTLPQLIDRVKKDDYSNRIAFERYVQAKLGAQESALNLLPHFNVNDVLNILSLNIVTIFKSIGDLAPFLFPEKWLAAHAALWQQRAQEQSWEAAVLDAGEIVEGLAYAVVRDQRALDRLATHRSDIVKVRDIVRRREEAGLMQIGSSDDISAVLNSMDEATTLLQQSVDSEYSALAQASGFNNPKAISSVEGIVEEAPASAGAPTVDVLIPLVLQAAPELRQMQDLVQAQDLDKKASYFGWIDPSSDAPGVGFGTADTIAIAASNLKEMELKRDQLKTILTQKASDAVDVYSQVLSTFKLGSEGADIQARRVDRLTKNLTQGLVVAMSDLVSALEGATQSDLQVVNAEYNAKIAQSRLDRLTLTGIYQELHEHPGP